MIKLLKWQILIGLLMALGITTFSCLPERKPVPVPHPIKKRREKRQNDRAVPVKKTTEFPPIPH